MNRFLANNLNEFVLVLGHRKEELLKHVQQTYGKRVRLDVVTNPHFDTYNNLYSTWLAKHELAGSDFILANGDLILNKGIIGEILKQDDRSGIALDDSDRESPIDSPGTIVRDERIYDLGRHIPFAQNGGYAIGLYRFNKTLSRAFFDKAESMLEGGDGQAGFHDPLPLLFAQYPVYRVSTKGLSWADVDTADEIPRARSVLRRIMEEEERGAQ